MSSEAGHFLLHLRQLILCYTLNIFLFSCSSPILEKMEVGREIISVQEPAHIFQAHHFSL